MKNIKIRCPYCGSPAVLKDASYVHHDKSKGGQLYVCSRYPACDSYVGVHSGTILPKGTLADQNLRRKRIQTHRIFDQIWKREILSKQDAYRWMADKFCLNPKDAHIGNFSDYMCDQLIQEASKVLHNNQKQFSPAGCRREAA